MGGPPLVAAAIAHFTGASDAITEYALFIFGFGFQAGWGIVAWIYPSELFAMNEKEPALALCTFCNFGLNVVVVFITKILVDWSQGAMYLLFGLFNISNIFFVMFCMKETKGVPLEDVPVMFAPRDKQGCPLATASDIQA